MIYPYSQLDTDEIIRIWLISSIEVHHFIQADYWKSQIKEMREKYLPASETYVFKLKQTNEIVGFISLVENYLAAIFIKPSFQRKGIGSELINYVKTIRKELTLHVYVDNRNSVIFYQHKGFTIIGEQIDKNTGVKEYIMKWSEFN